MASDDEYEADSFADFTEDDYLQIDVVTAIAESLHPSVNNTTAGPAITIELEEGELQGEGESSDTTCKGKGKEKEVDVEALIAARNKLPLIKGYRRKGILYVSDLASSVWCEVQYEYGLLQRRWRPVWQRPTTFKSRKGKEITVQTAIADKNDQITQRGKAVHKDLELEVLPERMLVGIVTDEEHEALHMLNMYACMQILLTDGLTREIPIYGIIQDNVVMGIIDEIIVVGEIEKDEPTEGSPEKRRKLDPKPDKEQHNLEDCIAPSKGKGRAQGSPMKLRLLDSKTRRVMYPPSDDDAKGSRMQLMLYHRLLNDLLSPEFDFFRLWAKIGLDPDKKFSEKFIGEAGLSNKDGQVVYDCLSGVEKLWQGLRDSFGPVTIDPVLTLVYRWVPEGGPIGRSKVKRIRDDEDVTVQGAIELSLQDLKRTLACKAPLPGQPKVDEASVPPVEGLIVEEDTAHKVICTKEFLYDANLLDPHVADNLDWWHGRREARGVPIQHAWRCHQCEYQDGCEWIEQKATEHAKTRASRR
ncbi:hypothetical protein BDN72DRAFT_953901 [Pluteus cervinus]|uniref:Uncharacterized protein n=1 Tax=Pluteus cervinus TaxID=181527 RepID=A0ACD3BH81_9AGAR|nr:hypothetical protein BDN72DRAFT_953901 [Pluteus cervinus]